MFHFETWALVFHFETFAAGCISITSDSPDTAVFQKNQHGWGIYFTVAATTNDENGPIEHSYAAILGETIWFQMDKNHGFVTLPPLFQLPCYIASRRILAVFHE